MTNEVLIQKYLDGDETALPELIEQLQGFIRSLATQTAENHNCIHYSAKGVYDGRTRFLLDDLTSQGRVIAYRRLSSKTYDTGKGKVTTYLYPHLKYGMGRWLRKNLDESSLSDHGFSQVRKVIQLYDEQRKTVEEIAGEMGLPKAAVVAYLTHSHQMVYLDACAEDGNGKFIYPNEMVPELQAKSAEHYADKNLRIDYLRELFDRLDLRDREILGQCFGVFGFQRTTVAEIAERQGVRPDAIEKAKNAALGRLREMVSGSRLERWANARKLVVATQRSMFRFQGK